MHKFPTPDVKPDRAPYVRIQVGEAGEVYTFRLPPPSMVTKLLTLYGEAAESKDVERLEDALGRLLGACWADENYGFDSDSKDGAAVFAELWEHGLNFAAVGSICSLLIERMVGTATEQEVSARARFFDGKVTTTTP